MEEKKTCCICNKQFEGWGNNPAPVKSEGVCCDDCNLSVVLPARLKEIEEDEQKESEIKEIIDDCIEKIDEIYDSGRFMFLVDVKNDKIGIHKIYKKNALQQYYKLLDCDLIDIAERKIGGKVFDIICDDEGLLKEGAIPSAINSKKEPMLVGNLLICNIADEHGEEVALEPEDIQLITDNLMQGRYEDDEGNEKTFPVVVCEYAFGEAVGEQEGL